jgi:SsrA-binding protein
MAKGSSNKPAANEPTVENRKARHTYAIGETLECGIKLLGTEVKSIRAGRISIGEGFVIATDEPPTLVLLNVHIDEMTRSAASTYRPTQTRTLLAHKKEIRKLARAAQSKGVTLVPLKVYFKGGRVKILIGVGTGKKQHDKREDIKKRDVERDIRRVMSKRM